MAFDGITIANITKELQDTLTGGRISKIAQPEKDELLLTIKSSAGQFRLCIQSHDCPQFLHASPQAHQ